MTEEEHDKVIEAVSILQKHIHQLVDEVLLGVPEITPEMEELIRTQLSEQVRFWK